MCVQATWPPVKHQESRRLSQSYPQADCRQCLQPEARGLRGVTTQAPQEPREKGSSCFTPPRQAMAQHSWEGRKGRREDEGGAQEELEDVAQVAQIRGAGTRSMGQQICRIPATFLKGKKIPHNIHLLLQM